MNEKYTRNNPAGKGLKILWHTCITDWTDAHVLVDLVLAGGTISTEMRYTVVDILTTISAGPAILTNAHMVGHKVFTAEINQSLCINHVWSLIRNIVSKMFLNV